MKINRLGVILLFIAAAPNPLHAGKDGEEDGVSPEHECDHASVYIHADKTSLAPTSPDPLVPTP
jgi:hypothetical protein